MKVKKDIKRTLSFNPEKCEKLYTRLVEVFQEDKPTVGEIIIAISNLLYTLGASIERYSEKGPSPEELEKLYYMNPGRVGLAMMSQGMIMSGWYEDWVGLTLEEANEEQGVPKNK